jgi:hypothetical protein
MSTPAPGAEISEDGNYWWDGADWQTIGQVGHSAAEAGHGAATVAIDWGQYPTVRAVVESGTLDAFLQHLGVSPEDGKDGPDGEYGRALDRALTDLHSQTGGAPEQIGLDAIPWLLDAICVRDGVQDALAVLSVNLATDIAGYRAVNDAQQGLTDEQVALYHVAHP